LIGTIFLETKTVELIRKIIVLNWGVTVEHNFKIERKEFETLIQSSQKELQLENLKIFFTNNQFIKRVGTYVLFGKLRKIIDK